MILLIKNARIYAPKELGVKDILVLNSKIYKVEDKISKGNYVDRVFDACGKILTPGFIDQHVHLVGAGGKDGFKSLTSEVNFYDLITCGTTTAVGLLGTDGVSKSLNALFAKTKSLNSQGLSSYMYCGYYGKDTPTLTGSIKTDLMFVENILGCKIAISDTRSSYPTTHELLKKLNDVKLGGFLSNKKGILHVHLGNLPSKMDQLFEMIDKYNFPVEHISPTHVARTKDLFEQAIIFASKGGMIDITTGASKFTDPYKAVIHGIDSGISINSMTFSTDGHAGLSVYDKKGIQIGTKKAPIDANLKQFILLVNKGGFSIEDSLKLVTSNPSRNLGLKNKGTLSIGNDADFCLFDSKLNLMDVFANGQQFLKEGKKIKSNYDVT